jgi:tRNA threonylcarbamoyladenosine biosynthesis protein TsaB
MQILALETSGQSGSVALMDGDSLVAERWLPTDERNAKTLAPAIREVLSSVGWTPSDVRLVAVAVGPGSFTGLRVGVTTAKTLAYAVGAEVIGVNTLEVIAAQVPRDANRLAVVLDAQRQQVFAAEFVRGPTSDFNWAHDTAIVDNDEWLAKLDPEVAVSGLGLEKLVARLPDNLTVIACEHWQPRAAIVGQLAWRKYQAGQRDDLWRLVPQYFRRSAAEEKLDRK